MFSRNISISVLRAARSLLDTIKAKAVSLSEPEGEPAWKSTNEYYDFWFTDKDLSLLEKLNTIASLALSRAATSGSPLLPMLADPVEKSLFKANIGTDLLGFDPLMAQDFIPFGEELFVKT